VTAKDDWKGFYARIMAMTPGPNMNFVLNIGNVLYARMRILDPDQAVGMFSVVYRAACEALQLDPMQLFEAMAAEGYFGENVTVQVIHYPAPECRCEKCEAFRREVLGETPDEELN